MAVKQQTDLKTTRTGSMQMNISRNQTVIIAAIVLAVILFVAFGAAKLVDNKEKNAAETISKQYNEEFIPVKSGAGLFGDNFDITVQSEKSKSVYDFDVKGEVISGTYYNENINVDLSKLIQSKMKSFAMVNAKMPLLTEEKPVRDVGIEEISAILITQSKLDNSSAEDIAAILREAAGDVPITLDVLVVENAEDYNGVTFEIENFFQRSSVTKDSFNSLDFDEQQFTF